MILELFGSGAIYFAAAAALSLILLIVARKKIFPLRILQHFRRRGIEVTTKKKVVVSADASAHAELQKVMENLNDVLRREQQTKEMHENIILSEVEKLHSKIKGRKPLPKIMVVDQPSSASGVIGDDVKKVLSKVDELLEHLPEDIVDDFVKSKDFELYKKVMTQAK